MVEVAEIFGRSGAVGPDFVSRYTRQFRVIFPAGTGWQRGPISAKQAVGLQIGERYNNGFGEIDLFSFVNSIEAKEEDYEDGRSWIVTVSYGPWEPQSPDGPTHNPVEVEIDYTRFERIVDQDVVDGTAVVNSAGDPFDPPVTADDSRLVLTFVRNEDTYDVELAEAVRDTINASAWRGFAPLTVKASGPKASRQFHPKIGFYWRVTYQFEFNRDGWRKVILDAGFRRKVSGTPSSQKAITSKDNLPVTSPVPLNGSGQPVAPGGTAHWLTFKVYPEIDFSIFGLDNV